MSAVLFVVILGDGLHIASQSYALSLQLVQMLGLSVTVGTLS